MHMIDSLQRLHERRRFYGPSELASQRVLYPLFSRMACLQGP